MTCIFLSGGAYNFGRQANVLRTQLQKLGGLDAMMCTLIIFYEFWKLPDQLDQQDPTCETNSETFLAML